MLKHLDEQPDPVMTKTKPGTKRRSKAQKLSLNAAHAAQTLNSKLKIAEGSINLQLTRALAPLLELQSTQKQLVETIATLIAEKKWALEAIGHANEIKIYSKLLQDQVHSLKSALLDSQEKSTCTYRLLQNKWQKNLHAQASKFATLAQLNIMVSYNLPKALQEACIATKALSNLTDTSEHKISLLTHYLDLANAKAAQLTKSLAESWKQVHQLQNKLVHSMKSLSKASAKGSVLKKP